MIMDEVMILRARSNGINYWGNVETRNQLYTYYQLLSALWKDDERSEHSRSFKTEKR